MGKNAIQIQSDVHLFLFQGYTDEPVSKILCQVEDGTVVQLDRWNLQVERSSVQPEDGSQKVRIRKISQILRSQLFIYLYNLQTLVSVFIFFEQYLNKKSVCFCSQLPLNVFNNYFSLGFDAHVTLEFHESRG